jgi:hypothetical protein
MSCVTLLGVTLVFGAAGFSCATAACVNEIANTPTITDPGVMCLLPLNDFLQLEGDNASSLAAKRGNGPRGCQGCSSFR